LNPLLPARPQSRLVLASSSPRRAEILRMLGFEFEVVPADVDETVHGRPQPEAYVCGLARLKARAADPGRRRGVFIGADTVVVVDGDILGKPSDTGQALGMLQRLRGRWHRVYTGLALLDRESGREASGVESTEVCFHDRDDDFLRRYVATGECMDKAGAYAVQGFGALLVREIRGCYFNVMGLPASRFVELLLGLCEGEVEHAG
jgi:septum formation protein